MICLATVYLLQEKGGAVRRYRLIFRAWRRHPQTGEKLWARDYGYRAWPLWVEVK